MPREYIHIIATTFYCLFYYVWIELEGVLEAN